MDGKRLDLESINMKLGAKGRAASCNRAALGFGSINKEEAGSLQAGLTTRPINRILPVLFSRIINTNG